MPLAAREFLRTGGHKKTGAEAPVFREKSDLKPVKGLQVGLEERGLVAITAAVITASAAITTVPSVPTVTIAAPPTTTTATAARTTATTATATESTTATTTGRTLLTGTGDVDRQCTALELFSMEQFDGLLGLGGTGEFNECEPTGLAREFVEHDVDAHHHAGLREIILQVLIHGLVREIAYEEAGLVFRHNCVLLYPANLHRCRKPLPTQGFCGATHCLGRAEPST